MTADECVQAIELNEARAMLRGKMHDVTICIGILLIKAPHLDDD